MLQEVTAAAGGIVLFIDEMHTLVGAGKSEGAMDASNLLKPALARGELHCVGATTLDEYRKHVEKDAALARRFQPVFVGEPSVEDTVSILRGLKEKYEQHHGVRVTDSALVAAATLSNRYITDRFLPDKAIDLVDEAASRLRMQVELEARGARQRRPRDRAPEDRGRGPEEGDRRRLEGAPPAPGEGACGSRGAVRRDHGALEGREGQARPRRRAEEEARRSPQPARQRAARRRLGQGRRALLRHHPGHREGAAGDRGEGRRRRPHGRGGDAGPCRRRRLALDRHPGRQDARGRAREAPQDGGGDLTARRRPARGGRGGLDGGAPRPRRPAGPEPADRLVHVPRADRRRQDRAHEGARGLPLRRRGRDGADRHVRVHGEALRRPAHRRAARLCRLRGRRGADRGGPAPVRTR